MQLWNPMHQYYYGDQYLLHIHRIVESYIVGQNNWNYRYGLKILGKHY